MAVKNIFTTFEVMDILYPDNYTDYIINSTEELAFTCEDDTLGLATFETVLQPVLYSVIFLVGALGNGLMITVLLRRWRLLRITEIYLLHLALSDLMLLFTFPFSVVDCVAGWLFGDFLCKLVGLMKNLNLLCGSFLLACIGFDRYLAIVHAVHSMRNRRPRTVHLTCLALWLVCLGLSIPNVVFLTVREDYTNASILSCYFHHHGIHGHNWVLTIRVLEHVSFFLSLAVMSYCYTAVVVTLCHSQKSQAKQGAIRLALLITVVFCACWLPYNVTSLVETLVELKVIRYESCEPEARLALAHGLTKSLGFSHCCLNPFLYAFVGMRFRNEMIRLLCKLGSRPSTSEGATSVSTVV